MKFAGFARGAKRLLPLLPAVLIGCAHSGKQGKTYQYEVGKAYDEAEARLGARGGVVAGMSRRTPAASGIDISTLQRVSPGKFKIYVFPKLRTIAEKSEFDDGPLFTSAADERFSRLGRPEEFEVSTVASNPCHKFIEGGLFAALGPKDRFDPQLGEDKRRGCAIVEITSMKIKEANRALIRRDDVLRLRLFLDDAYVLHGYDIEKYVDSRNTRVIRVKSDRGDASTSGLTRFPVDIPTLAILGGAESARGQVDAGAKLDRLAMNQVRGKFMRSFEVGSCAGAVSRYRDYFGSEVEVGWCDGVPFPQYMENARFVAVTQTLSVR